MKIRQMKEKDLEEIVRIGEKTPELTVRKGENFWNKHDLSRWIKDKGNVCLVAVDKENLLGFVTSTLNKSTCIALIENVYVKGSYRRRGIGNRLLHSCMQKLKKSGARYIFTLVKMHNKDATKFFEKNGFKRGYVFAWMTGYDKS